MQEQRHSGAEGSSYRGGASLLAMQRLLGTLLLGAVMTAAPLPAQTNVAKAAPSKRCLLVVETSRAMQRRTEATLKVVQDLVTSGLNGQFRRGDSFGVWTFNDALYAGQLPMQTWSPETREETAARIVSFLKAQKWEKTASFDKVLPALAYVVERSDRLTVVLISSGEEGFHGTPYDKAVSEFEQRLHDQQQKARMPFVTVLSARSGRLVDYTLNTPPWPLQLPTPPPEAQAADTLQQRLQEALQGGHATSAPPLIVSGRKPQPKPAPSPTLEAATAKVQATGPAATSGTTNRPPATAPPSALPAQVAMLNAAPPAPALLASQLAPQPASVLMPTTKPQVQAVQAPQVRLTQAVQIQSNPAPPSPGVLPKPQVPVAVQPKPALPAGSKPPATPAPSAPPAASVSARSNATGTASGPTRPSPAIPRPSAPPTPLEQAATVVPGGKLGLALWLGALALAVVAVLFALIWLRWSPSRPQGSLITRSYDRGRKP
jgi:hypothetical protein